MGISRYFQAVSLRHDIRHGRVAALERRIAQGADPVALYDEARQIKKPHPKSLDFLEREIEDAAVIPGTHVPRYHGWKIKR